MTMPMTSAAMTMMIITASDDNANSCDDINDSCNYNSCNDTNDNCNYNYDDKSDNCTDNANDESCNDNRFNATITNALILKLQQL